MAPPVRKAHVTRHIDRKLFDEATRLMLGNVGDREAASSFVSEESAQALCDDIVADHAEDIRRWLQDKGTTRISFEKEFDKSDIARLKVPVSGIGFVTDPSTRRIWMAKSSRVRLVLKRNPARPEGYERYTAFPMIDEEVAERLDIDPLPYFMASEVWLRSTPVKRAFLLMSCDHGSRFPLWYEFNTDSIELRIAEGRQEFGFVFINSDERPCWMIKDCKSLRMDRKLHDIVMRRAFPMTCDRIDAVRSAIGAQRIQKDLEQTGMMEVEPFVPDRRVSEILREAEGIIRAAETAEKARQMRLAAAEESERREAERTEQRESAKEAARRKATRRSRKASGKARRRNEQERLRRQRAEEKARRKAERQAMEEERDAKAAERSADEGSTPAPQVSSGQTRGNSAAATPPAEPKVAGGKRDAETEGDNAENAFVGYRIPQYNPDTNDILVVWMGVGKLLGADQPKRGRSRAAGLVLHGDEADIHAAFARYRELNSELAESIARRREEALTAREGRNLTEVDPENGLPSVDDEGDMVVDDRDVRPFDGGGYDLFCPEWLEFDDVADRRIVVEVPFPQPLGHLVDEGRYDLVTFDVAMSMMGADNGWTPLISSDLLASIGIEYLMDASDSEPMLMDDEGNVVPDAMRDAEAADADEPDDAGIGEESPEDEVAGGRRRSTGQRISRPRASTRYPRAKGRILAMPSFTTKEIPDEHYMSIQEKLTMRIAEERAEAISAGDPPVPEAGQPRQATNPLTPADMSDLDPRERLRRMMGSGDERISEIGGAFRPDTVIGNGLPKH